MDNTGYLEYIIPIIFFAIWVIGKIFGKKDSKEEGADSEDAKVYPYPLKEQYEKVSDSVNQVERDRERLIVYQREQKEIEQRRFLEEKYLETNLKNGFSQNVPIMSNEMCEKKERRSALLELIQDSNSLKKTFLISEILNAPLALRHREKERL